MFLSKVLVQCTFLYWGRGDTLSVQAGRYSCSAKQYIYDIQGTLDPRNVKEIVRGTQQSSVSGQEEAEVEDLRNAEVTNFAAERTAR